MSVVTQLTTKLKLWSSKL